MIPYKGAQEALVDVAAGQANAALLPFGSVKSQVQNGKLRVIAAFAGKVDQVDASGQTQFANLQRFNTTNWIAAFASTKLSEADARKFGEYIAGIAATKSFSEALQKKGIASADPLGPLEFRAQVKAEYAATRAAVAKANLRAN